MRSILKNVKQRRVIIHIKHIKLEKTHAYSCILMFQSFCLISLYYTSYPCSLNLHESLQMHVNVSFTIRTFNHILTSSFPHMLELPLFFFSLFITVSIPPYPSINTFSRKEACIFKEPFSNRYLFTYAFCIFSLAFSLSLSLLFMSTSNYFDILNF